MTIATNIKKIRLLRNFKQKYMARALMMSHANYSKIENGKVRVSPGRIESIAAILAVTQDDLVGAGGALSDQPGSGKLKGIERKLNQKVSNHSLENR